MERSYDFLPPREPDAEASSSEETEGGWLSYGENKNKQRTRA